MLPVIIQQPEKSAWVDILTIIVPAGVTIIGLFVNYVFTNRNIKNEINKKKVDISLEYLSKAPYESLDLLEKLLKQDKKALEVFVEFANTVFSYGSEDAIKILGQLQQNNYALAQGGGDKNKTMAYFILLTCQIKADLTGIKVNPELWYRLKINDYETNLENKEKFRKATNEVVEELNLAEFLKIK